MRSFRLTITAVPGTSPSCTNIGIENPHFGMRFRCPEMGPDARDGGGILHRALEGDSPPSARASAMPPCLVHSHGGSAPLEAAKLESSALPHPGVC
jgi:hypothetical protein